MCLSEQISGIKGLSQQSHTPVSVTVIFMDQVANTAKSHETHFSQSTSL